MSVRIYQRIFLILAIAVGATLATGESLPASLQGEVLTAEQRRGQQIFLQGTTSSGRDIVGSMGNSSAELPASYLACANCHGRDGTGKPEGGIVPSNLTWEVLTKPYGVVHPSGRKHPPYDERLFTRAITLGIDPAGNKLHPLMPRYQFTREDASDLIAYIKVLGKHLDPGLSDTSIRIGATVITTGPFAEMSQSVKAVLTAYFEEVNKQGGVFNRRIELQSVMSETSPQQRIDALRVAIDNDQLFALVGTFMAGAEEEFASVVQEKSIPMIGAFTLSPPVRVPPNPFGFYIYSGLKDQCHALATFAADKYPSENPQAAIIYIDDKPTREAAQAIRQKLTKSGWTNVEEFKAQVGQFDVDRIVESLSNKATKAIFILAPADVQEAIIEKIKWRPAYFIPGLLAGRKAIEFSKDGDELIYLSVSSLPSDQTAEALAEYKRLAELYKLPASHSASQMQALAAAITMVEGFKRVGRSLSRQKFIESLEGMYQFKTGLTPPLTFSPNRRIGAAGACIITFDRMHGLVPVSKWIEPD